MRMGYANHRKLRRAEPFFALHIISSLLVFDEPARHCGPQRASCSSAAVSCGGDWTLETHPCSIRPLPSPLVLDLRFLHRCCHHCLLALLTPDLQSLPPLHNATAFSYTAGFSYSLILRARSSRQRCTRRQDGEPSGQNAQDLQSAES